MHAGHNASAISTNKIIGHICNLTRKIGGIGKGKQKKFSDWDEIRTHAGRAHWISSPTP